MQIRNKRDKSPVSWLKPVIFYKENRQNLFGTIFQTNNSVQYDPIVSTVLV